MRVLLIEDDAAMSKGIDLILRNKGMSVYSTTQGDEGIDLAKMYDYDIVLLDLSLPDMNGIDVVKALRAAKVKTPILVLTGNALVESKVSAITKGADDYMTKPFHKDELIARIIAIVRRSQAQAHSVITTGQYSVNMDTQSVEVAGRRLHLTIKEYQMMELLALRKGMTISKEMFLNHLYNGMDEPEIKIIDVFICKIRKKIADATNGEHCIETVWGCGYRMQEPRPVLSLALAA